MKPYILFLTLCLCTQVIGQNLSYQNFTEEDGLPSPEVYNIIQDDWGNMWFATDHGLSRYNGYEFDNFSTRDGLTDNTIFNFYKQENGEIWCNAFNHKIFCISGQVPVFIPYKYNHLITPALADIEIDHEIYVDESGTVFLGYANKIGFLQIDSSGQLTNHLSEAEKTPMRWIAMRIVNGSKVFSWIANDSIPKEDCAISPRFDDVNLFVRTAYLSNHKAALYMYKYNILIVGEHQTNQLSFTAQPMATGQFDASHFWVGCRGDGIHVLDHRGKETAHLLKGRSVTDVFVDHEGSYWVSTLSSGVFRFKNMEVSMIEMPTGDKSWIESLAKDEKGQLFAGSYIGDISQVKGGVLEPLYESTNKKPAMIHHANGRWFFNLSGHLSELRNGNITQLLEGEFFSWTIHKNKHIIGRNSHLFVEEKDGQWKDIPNKYRCSALSSFRDSLFMATKYGLVVVSEDSIFPIHQDKPICTVRIDALKTTGDALLMGSRGYGLGVLKDDKVKIIGKENGLTSDFISNIYVEDDHQIWLCTNAGLNLLTLSDTGYTIQSITSSEGLISNNVSDIEVINDTVWVATRSGICYFHKSMLSQEKETLETCFLRFLGLKINDRPHDLTNKIELAYDQNRLEFRFQGISYASRSPLQYRYKMDGLESEWTTTESRSALYPSLPPGNYKFIVEAINDDLKWQQKQISIEVTIHPAFWQTLWFKLSIAGVIILLIYTFFRYNILTYNRTIVRELLRHLLKRVRKKTLYVVIREQGKDIKIDSAEICFVKSAGNYLEIHTDDTKHVIRAKIGEFQKLVPDPIEYLQIHRSYIVRLDKVEQKGIKDIVIKGEQLPVGKTFIKKLKEIQLEA